MITGSKLGSFQSLFARLASEDTGGEAIEWVLLVGLIAVVCIVAMKGFGITLTGWWNSAVNAL